MSARMVRADYEDLKQVGQQFSRQTHATRETLQKLKQNVEILQRGDWVGEGANKFYEEMNSAVLPSLQRLVDALETAGQRTQEISRIMQEAEDEAASLLRALGGLAPGSAAAFVHAAAGGGGGGGGSGTVAGGSPSTSVITLDNMFGGLDTPVKQIIINSRLILSEIERLEREGWHTLQGHPTGYDAKNKTITIDDQTSVDVQLHVIANAAADALHPSLPLDPLKLSRQQYVRAATNEELLKQGSRIYNDYVFMGDLKGQGIKYSPDIPIGTNRKDYDSVYQSTSKQTTVEQGIQQMGDLVGSEATHANAPLPQTWREYYETMAAGHWDALNPGKGK